MMSSLPLVSIVVATYNQGRYLTKALDSLMFQDYPKLEIIICNHGSTDNTSDIIRDYLDSVETNTVSYLAYYDDKAKNDKRFVRSYENRFPKGRHIKVIESAENIGGTRSYNEGFKQVTGKYCTYLVADDYFLHTAIREMVMTLEDHEADVVYSDMFVVNDEGRILQRLEKPEYSFKACFSDWFHLGVSRLYRRDLHDRIGFYNPSYRNANDYDMFLRFAIAGAKFVHLPKVLYCSRKHNPNDPTEPAAWRNNGYQNLLRESIECAERARAFQKSKGRSE